jgi:flavin reductase (DIM6/NTAB) family NADH-FMN oxidoreductase RutF
MPKTLLPPQVEALYPVPVVLVTSGDKDEANVITIAWCGVVCSQPPMLSISVRPSRHSHKLIERCGNFVVNIPDEGLINKTDYCGIVSGSATNKFKACDFTLTPSSKVSSPMIGECPVNIECRVTKRLSLGAHDMFIGEVLAVHVDKSVTGKDGAIDFKKARPFVFNRGEYWSLGAKIGHYGFSSKNEVRRS